jgi:hypothetical protein
MKKVMMVGFAYFDERLYEGHKDADIWCVNNFWQRKTFKLTAEDVDRVYQIHKTDKLWSGTIEHYNRVGKVVSAQEIKGLNNVTLFDYDNLFVGDDYLLAGLSFSYMIADAIKEGYEHIIFNGVTLSTKQEYKEQIPIMLQNIEVARKHGVKCYAFSERMWRQSLRKVKAEDTAYVLYGYTEDKASVYSLLKSVNSPLVRKIHGYKRWEEAS